MKSIFKVLCLLAASGLSAQSVSEYAYVYVPKKFKDFKTNNEYNLNKILSLKLGDKNYRIVSDERELWPAELQQNNCAVLNAEVLNDSNMFKNRVKLNFTDCTGKTVLSIPATGDFKEFDRGYQDALVKAIANVPPSTNSGKVLPVLREENVVKTQPTTIQTPAERAADSVSKTANKAEVFANGNNAFNRVILSSGQFIFTSANSSVPFATFRETTKPGVYRVQLENGMQTLGYDEANNLVIEIPLQDGSFRKEIYTKR